MCIRDRHITIAAAVEKTAAKFGGLNMISDMECFKKFLFSEVTAYTEPSIGAVSYTHLDVYKRQRPDCLPEPL